MKITIDLSALNDNFSGIERYAMNMALALLAQNTGDTYELVFKNEVHPAFFKFQDQQHVTFCVLKGVNKLLFNQWTLPRYLNRTSADVYLFFAFPMPLLLRKKRVFGTIHDMGCWDCPQTMKRQMVWYFRLSYRWMAKRAERIITISEFSRSRIEHILKVRSDRILVAYCGLSENFKNRQEISAERAAQIRQLYHLPDEYFLCLSTLEPRKNMQFLLDAYLELYRQGKIRTKLVLAGRKGWKIEQLLQAVDAEQDGQVSVTGFIEDADLPAVYQLSKCFLFPSLYEGFGIPPLEAMSQGVSVISSDASSMPEVLGDAATYFETNNRQALQQALLRAENGTSGELQACVEKGMQRSSRFRYEKEAVNIQDALHLPGNKI